MLRMSHSCPKLLTYSALLTSVIVRDINHRHKSQVYCDYQTRSCLSTGSYICSLCLSKYLPWLEMCSKSCTQCMSPLCAGRVRGRYPTSPTYPRDAGYLALMAAKLLRRNVRVWSQSADNPLHVQKSRRA